MHRYKRPRSTAFWLFTTRNRLWKKISTALQSQSSTKASVRALKRLFFGSAAELEYDKQGRVLIPVPLREYASLDKQAVIVGAGGPR